MGKFGETQLVNMVAVGKVTPVSVRLWMRSSRPGKHHIEIDPYTEGEPTIIVPTVIAGDGAADFTHSVEYPRDFPGAAPLTPSSRYNYRIVRDSDGAPIGAGRFATTPASDDQTPEGYAVALMSCHQPFNTDGELSERSVRMLRLVPEVLSGYNAKFVITCGDQIYADVPQDFSLLNPHYAQKLDSTKQSILDWSAAEVRRAYQERYRIFWSMNEVRHMYANYPCYPILDDHEIMDDWGSNAAHSQKRFANLAQGAREAYFDYQGSRVCARGAKLPLSFHYEFGYGSLGAFVWDIRSQRRTGDRENRLYSPKQFADFERFLNKNGHKRVLLIVTSVPVVHLPSWLTDVGAALVGDTIDFPDHWSYKKNVPARDRLLIRLHQHQEAHPNQRVVLVSGDVHVGCAFAIHWRYGKKAKLYQLTSSAVSNRMKKRDTYFSEIPPNLVSKLACKDGPSARVNLLKAAEGRDSNNPFGGLNIGIIGIRDRGDHSTVNLKLIGYPEADKLTPVTMFGTGEL